MRITRLLTSATPRRYTDIYLHVLLALVLVPLAGCAFPTYSQTASSLDIDRGRGMLTAIKSDLKKNYYDPQYHGIDIEARFKAADDKIKQAASLSQILGIIAQTLLDL